MSSLEELKKVVKEAVTGNKLSASRVEATKKASTRCFDRAQLVKPELLRIHTSASPSSKICSLYLFDAIVRNARDVVKKNGAGLDVAKVLPSVAKASDPKAALVSAAREFLNEMASIATDIVVDTVKSVKPELREKVDKIIDIWRKAETFEPQLLNQLESAAKSASASTSTLENANRLGNGNGGMGDPRRSQGHAVGKGSSSLMRSTTPVGSPPRRLKEQFQQSGSASAGASSTPSAPPGLPPNLAALLGGSAPVDASSAAMASTGAGTGTTAGTQDFMASLNMLMSARTSNNDFAAPASLPANSSAGPSFDLSQLTALQSLAPPVAPAAPAAAASHTAPSQTSSKPTPPPPPAAAPPPVRPPPPPPPPPSSQSSTLPSSSSSQPVWPPQPNENAGDLSTFDVTVFNPTISNQWIELAQRWANTYGYMPAVAELGMNYLIFYQTALMSATSQHQQGWQQQQQQDGGGGGGQGDGNNSRHVQAFAQGGQGFASQQQQQQQNAWQASGGVDASGWS